jgi:hypothetical protein
LPKSVEIVHSPECDASIGGMGEVYRARDSLVKRFVMELVEGPTASSSCESPTTVGASIRRRRGSAAVSG